MRRTALLAAAVGGLFATSSFAAFTVTAQPATVAGLGAGLVAYDLFAKNLGTNGTGTKLQAASIAYTTSSGKKAYFNVLDNDDGGGNGPDGVPDSAFLFNFNTGADTKLSSVRISSTATNGGALANPAMSYASGTPAGFDGSFVQPNPWAGGIAAFTVDYAALSAAAAAPATAGFGARFARLIVDSAGQAVVTGNIGGEIGTKDTYSLTLGGVTNTPPVVTVAPTSLTIDVSPAGLESGGPVVITATDEGSVASLNAGSLGVLADNITITGTTTKTLSLSGLNYTDVGTTVITFTATDNQGATGTGTLTINIVPEPASLSLIGLAGLGMIRRRK